MNSKRREFANRANALCRFNRWIFGVAQPVFEICEAVLAVNFLSLGLRPGLVVALAIPLVLAITFVALEYLGIRYSESRSAP